MVTYTIVSAASAAAFTSSAVIDLGDMDGYSIEVSFSGGAGNVVGTFFLEGSNTKNSWTTVTGSSQAVTSSAGVLYVVSNGKYRYVRLSFTYTSGTGNITATALVKENVIKGA